MIASRRRWLLAFGLVGAVGVSALVLVLMRSRPTVTMLEPPGRDSASGIQGDTAVLVSGRRVTPVGRVVRVQSYSWGLALSPDQSRAVLVNPSAFQLVELREPFLAARIPPYGTEGSPDFGSGSYMGCAFSRDGRLLYYGSADAGQIKVFDLASGRVIDTIHLNVGGYADSFVGDFILSADGSRLYAIDQFNYRLVVFDLRRDRVVRSIRVGRNPFAVALSSDGRYAWVANVGMFEYPLLPGVTSRNRRKAGLSFPAYGVPSKEAERGSTAEGIEVPGLGDANHPDAMSVFKVNLATGAVETRTKTGYPVGVERDAIRTIGGASPGSLAVGKRFVYVANATNDNISIVDADSGRVVQHIDLKVPGLENLRGVLPFGVALAPEESRLYVACAGLNAVAVIDLVARKVEGYIPAGWFCSKVAVSTDGRTLYIASAKGLGAGPNGGHDFVAPDRGLHPADIMQGTLQVVAVPGRTGLDAYTRQVIDNTYWRHEVEDDPQNPVPPLPNRRQSPIRHIVFVVKENRTFDQVFGQRSGVNGDPSVTTLGLGMEVTSSDKTRTLSGVDVSPNHHALADRFAISDNFYCDSDQSNTGHRWVAGVYPNEWVEVNARSHMEERIFSSAPGRRAVAGSSAVVLPEDYNEAGALWEHLDRHGIPFFNFGFGTEMPASLEERASKETGVRMAVSFPLPAPLLKRTSRKYPTFNMAIPDQYRMDMFDEELRARWLSGKEPFPRLVAMVLPNDHLADERPKDGYPFAESYMADNDLALGRLIHTLSRTPYWKDMLVIVTEDDPQGGRDHVEAHRSVLMLIGPHVKRGYVSHTLTSFGSIMRLIFTLLDLPPLNHFDATASLPLDFFSDHPDPAPFTVRPVDKRLFDPDVAFKPFDRRFNWKALAQSPVIDDPAEMRAQFARPASALGVVTLGKER